MVAAVLIIGVAVLVAGGGVVGLVRDRPAVGVPLLAAALLLAGAGTVFALVGADVTLAAADGPVLAALVGVRGPGLTGAAEAVSFVGGTAGTGGLAVLAAAVLALRGRRARAAVWVAGVAAGALSIRALKEVVERPRPPTPTRLAVETTSSLPSGHSLMAALGLGLAAAAVATLVGPAHRGLRRGVGALAVAGVLAVGASRAYLGVHWTTDVVSGWLLGAALGLICLAAARALEPAGEALRVTADPASGTG